MHFHLCVKIDELLLYSDEQLQGLVRHGGFFSNDCGARESLLDLKLSGEIFYSMTPCDNWSKEYGCLGHSTYEDVDENGGARG